MFKNIKKNSFKIYSNNLGKYAFKKKNTFGRPVYTIIIYKGK